MSAREESGLIRLDGDVIRYRSQHYGTWDMPVAELRLLGEYTNQDGPFADDWFLVFVSSPKLLPEASVYAEGREGFLDQLGAMLGAELGPELYASADFNSRVLWPSAMAGRALFDFFEKPPEGLLERVKRALRLQPICMKLADPVVSALAE